MVQEIFTMMRQDLLKLSIYRDTHTHKYRSAILRLQFTRSRRRGRRRETDRQSTPNIHSSTMRNCASIATLHPPEEEKRDKTGRRREHFQHTQQYNERNGCINSHSTSVISLFDNGSNLQNDVLKTITTQISTLKPSGAPWCRNANLLTPSNMHPREINSPPPNRYTPTHNRDRTDTHHNQMKNNNLTSTHRNANF